MARNLKIVPPNDKADSLNPEDAVLAALIERAKNNPVLGEIKLNRKEEDAIVEHVVRDFEDAMGDLQQFRLNMLEMTKNWRGTTDKKDFPFKDCANLRVPLTSVHIEGMKARIKKAIFGGDLITEIKRMDTTLTRPQMDDMNQWFQWELQEIAEIERKFDDGLHQLLVHGIAIATPSYKHEERFLRSIRRFVYTPGPAISLVLDALARKILEERGSWGAELRDGQTTIEKSDGVGTYDLSDGGQIIFSLVLDAQVGPSPAEPLTAGQGAPPQDAQGVGGPQGHPPQMANSMAGGPQAGGGQSPQTGEIVAEIWQREVTFDGACVNFIRLEDLVVSPSAKEIDDLPFFGWRYWVSADQYRQRLDDGFYRDLGKQENQRIAESSDDKISDYISQEETVAIDREEGVNTLDQSGTRPNRRWIEVYHWEGWWVWDPKGNPYTNDKILEQATQIAIEVTPRTKRCIKLNRLEDLNKDGKRSGVLFGFIEEPDRFFRIGLAEWLRHLQTLIDAINNQRVDAGLLNNIPFGFYDPATGLKKEVLSVEPGKFYPVRNPQGVNMPRSNWQPAISFQEELLAKRYAGEQSGITDQAIGQPVSKRQSASEFVGTLGATDLRTEQFVSRFLLSLRELLYRILGLYQQFGPPRRIFRATGSDGTEVTRVFERDRLQGKLLLRLTGNVQQINEQLQRQVAVDMLQLLLNEVLIKLGIVDQQTIYGAIKLVAKLMHYGDVPINKPDFVEKSEAPNVEHKQMSMGLTVRGPTINENFQEHMQSHAMMASNPQVHELLGSEGMQKLAEHMKATAIMQQQVQMLRQMQAAQAIQMQKTMAEKGIRPGMEGGQSPGDNADPGTQGEGVEGAAA